MDGVGAFVALVLVLAVAVALFAVFRAAVLWYLKIDRAVALLEEQTALARETRDALRNLSFDVTVDPAAAGVPAAPTAPAPEATATNARPVGSAIKWPE